MGPVVPPHAYVVEYRIADRCEVPRCAVQNRNLQKASAGDRVDTTKPGYLMFGSDKSELFSSRGVALEPHTRIEVDLPATASESRLDMELSSADPGGGAYRANIEISREGTILATFPFGGESATFTTPDTEDQAGRRNRFFMPVRVPLAFRHEGPVRIAIENVGDSALGVGVPIVARLVEGRAPRQAILVIFDAVAYPCLRGVFEAGPSWHARVGAAFSWLPDWVKGRGLYFRHGISPGQLTGSFVRRFFKGEFFRLDGEPSLLGQGFDDIPPERVSGPVVRLAEQGFVTEAIGSNLYLSPLLSRIGFDEGYNLESTLDLPAHPLVIARRFDEELSRHAEDDALFVLWYANTHAPWREGRTDAPPMVAENFAGVPVDSSVLEPMWRNVFDAVDSLRHVRSSAEERAPGADRIWLVGADHGHTFTQEARGRPWRLTHETFSNGHMHCCLATAQEASVPFVLIDESLAHGIEVADPHSMMSAWQLVARRFGVELDLPRTSTFALAPEVERTFASERRTLAEARPVVDDAIVVSVGNSGALAGRVGSLAYRAYQPAWSLAPAWTLEPSQARLLAGSPKPSQGILAEELYDLASDPGESNNLAHARFDDLVAVRTKLTDFLAAHVDTPDHPRFAHTLAFHQRGRVSILAPRAFGLSVDGSEAAIHASRTEVEGTRFTWIDQERDPVGLVELRGELVSSSKLVISCASSGLPLAVLDADHPRFNLALARTNCPVADQPKDPPPLGQAWFWASSEGALHPHHRNRVPPASNSVAGTVENPATGRAGGGAAARTVGAAGGGAAASGDEEQHGSLAGARSAAPAGVPAPAGSAALPELRNALRRWGYVREQ